MELYLVRHGEAKPKWEDMNRPLTEQGQKNVERVARFLQKAGVRVHQIRHSGKTRAAQTAEILAQHLEPTEGTVMISGLAPNDDFTLIAGQLQTETSVMLVSHLPLLDYLTGFLLTGNPELSMVKFQTAAVVHLVKYNGKWLLAGMITPDLISSI